MQRTYVCFTLRQGLVLYPRPVALLLPQLLKCLLGIPCPGSSFIFNHKCREYFAGDKVFVILFNPTRQPLTFQQKGLAFTKLNKSICSCTRDTYGSSVRESPEKFSRGEENALGMWWYRPVVVESSVLNKRRKPVGAVLCLSLLPGLPHWLSYDLCHGFLYDLCHGFLELWAHLQLFSVASCHQLSN